jgi:hypothetical protein
LGEVGLVGGCYYVAEYYYEWDEGGEEDSPVISGVFVRSRFRDRVDGSSRGCMLGAFPKHLPVHVRDFHEIGRLVESGDALPMGF